jgi:hypothetical protein
MPEEQKTTIVIPEGTPEGVMPVSPDDLSIAFSGPATLANRFFITLGPTGARIAFAEQATPDTPSIFRVAVVLPFQDALELTRVLGVLLAPVKDALAKAAGTGSRHA